MSSERKKLRLVELLLVFPEELAAIDDLAVAQVEQVERHQRRLGIHREDIDVVALGGGHLLALFDLFHGGDQVAQRRPLLRSASPGWQPPCGARRSRARSLCRPSRKSRTSRTARGVRFVGGQPLHARPQAAVNVILQARLGMKARQIDLAGRHQKMAVDEVHQAVRQVGRKVGTEVRGAVLAQAPRDVDARILFVGQLDVGIGLVVAQQDVEARLVLLDQVVFERERFLFVVDQDVVDIARFGNQRAGLDVGQLVLGKVAADAVPQDLRLADVDHPPAGVLVQIHSGREGELAYLFTEFHRGSGIFQLSNICRMVRRPRRLLPRSKVSRAAIGFSGICR